jgi:hypothetical protein
VVRPTWWGITGAKTFADAVAHVHGVKKRHGPPFLAVVLVGNKKDLHDKRAVTTEEGLALAAHHRDERSHSCARS